jgi:hypothetical protein
VDDKDVFEEFDGRAGVGDAMALVEEAVAAACAAAAARWAAILFETSLLTPSKALNSEVELLEITEEMASLVDS